MARAAIALLLAAILAAGGGALAQSSAPSIIAPDPADAAPAFQPPDEAEECRAGAALAPEQAAACREAFQRKVQDDVARVKAWREKALERHAEQQRLRRERGAGRAAPLESFLYERLEHGDVIVTDSGPLVYVGRSDETPKAQDFVPLDSPRSPQRRRAEELKKATRPR